MDKTIDCKEHCVYCGKKTKYSKDMPISDRICYIEGVGQLCTDCYENIYSRANSEIKFIED